MGKDDLEGITVQEAARRLGKESIRDQWDKRNMRTRWRYEQLRKFRTDWGRRHLVKLLERSLTGEESEPPESVVEAIGNLLEQDRVRKPDVPQLIGKGERSDTAQAYAKYRDEGSGR